MDGEELKALRLKKGYTREELANKLYITATTIYRWETDLRTPSKLYLEAFKKVCQ